MMDFNHLTEEEISYELALRHIVNVSSMTHRNKVLKLKALTQEEALRDVIHTSSDRAIDPTDNIENCSQGIQQLQSLVALAQKSGNSHDLSIISSRLTHYKNRLAIIAPPEHLVQTLQSLCQIVETLFVNVNSVVNRIVNQPTDRVNSGAGAIPKGHRQQTSSANQQSPFKTTEENEGNSSGHSSLRMSEEEVRKYGLPPSSSPLNASRGRGRGTPSTIPEDIRHRHAAVENTRENQAAGVNTEFRQRVRPNNSERQYNELRDDLLNRLIQMQLNQQQGNGRTDDRRMQKAIHNWPFKFRGERDTKTLNTFLDRVESFARSEGVSDEVLLTSIKHLLQEDALDWYARVEYQGLLDSCESFKQQIRKEYLPAQYGQLLRAEAFFRYQGQSESFAKYYRDITTLFRFAEPAMSEEEKLFIVKKNMHTDYALIITAAKPDNLADLAEVCSSYDDTRMLLNRQHRKMSIPHEFLVEPNLATPSSGQRPVQHTASTQRFNRVQAIELQELEQAASNDTHQTLSHYRPEEECEDDYWALKVNQLMDQVNAIKLQVDRRHYRASNNSANTVQLGNNPRSQWRPLQNNPQQYAQVEAAGQASQHRFLQQQRLTEQNQLASTDNQQHQAQHRSGHRHQDIQQNQAALENGRAHIVCWNCEEEGHRFADCRKQQAFLFCHGCGRRGYTLRNCVTCRTEAGNSLAEIR